MAISIFIHSQWAFLTYFLFPWFLDLFFLFGVVFLVVELGVCGFGNMPDEFVLTCIAYTEYVCA